MMQSIELVISSCDKYFYTTDTCTHLHVHLQYYISSTQRIPEAEVIYHNHGNYWKQAKLSQQNKSNSSKVSYGPFYRCHAIPNFFTQRKNMPHCLIYHAKCSKYANVHKNLLQTHENMGPQTCQCLKRNACQEVAISYTKNTKNCS